jgi:CelD/BcsL family acetyltransferase involved in cellulose biosynthesis/glycosyltransferase involved in cell wall biosynthesis
MLTVLNVGYPLSAVGPDAAGGAEQVLSAVEQAVARSGHRSLVLACHGSRAAGELFTVPCPPAPFTDDKKIAVRALYREAIERILATQAVDLVHLHGVDFHAYLPAGPTPILATLHLPPAWYPPEVFAPSRPGFHLNCVSLAQRRTCPPSQAMLDDICNGVDLARFRPCPHHGDYALMLGRVCPEKGIHLALEAARRADVPLLIAGQVFPYPEHVRYFDGEIRPRLDARRRFIGPVGLARKIELLAGARCVVVSSTVAETSSLAALEALASGTPVVAGRRGALPDLIEHGRTGFLVDDVAQLAEALTSTDRLDRAACRAAAERFPIEQTTQRYLDAYAKITGARERPAPSRAPCGREAPFRHPRAVTVDELTDLSAVRAIREEWDGLWQVCPDATIFQSPDWLLPWCEHLLVGAPLVLAVRRAGRLIGVAPFVRAGGVGGDRLSLMGAGVSDYTDLLTDPGERVTVAQTLEAWLGAHREFERCDWSDLPPDSLLLSLDDAGRGESNRVPRDACPALALRGRSTLSEALPRSKWAAVAYARRRAARDGAFEIESATAATRDDLMRRLADLHCARWNQRGGGVLADPRVQAFHADASRNLLARGALMLAALRVAGQVVAVVYGFHDRQATRYYLSGFDPAYARLGPGNLIVAHAIEQALRRGAELFDFLRGAEAYKYEWGATDRLRLQARTTWRSGVSHAPEATRSDGRAPPAPRRDPKAARPEPATAAPEALVAQGGASGDRG